METEDKELLERLGLSETKGRKVWDKYGREYSVIAISFNGVKVSVTVSDSSGKIKTIKES